MNLILPISKVKKKKKIVIIKRNLLKSPKIRFYLVQSFEFQNLSTSNKSIPLLRIHGTIRISRNIKSLSRVWKRVRKERRKKEICTRKHDPIPRTKKNLNDSILESFLPKIFPRTIKFHPSKKSQRHRMIPHRPIIIDYHPSIRVPHGGTARWKTVTYGPWISMGPGEQIAWLACSDDR